MSRDNLIQGSCLCGGVHYEAEGPLLFMTCCHCVQCRKASGAEFATNGSVPSAGFRIVSGAELLAEWESTAGQARVFCRRCGSPLFKRMADKPDLVRLRLGCVDTELAQRSLCHLFVAEKPDWSPIHDDLPQYDGFPTGSPR